MPTTHQQGSTTKTELELLLQELDASGDLCEPLKVVRRLRAATPTTRSKSQHSTALTDDGGKVVVFGGRQLSAAVRTGVAHAVERAAELTQEATIISPFLAMQVRSPGMAASKSCPALPSERSPTQWTPNQHAQPSKSAPTSPEADDKYVRPWAQKPRKVVPKRKVRQSANPKSRSKAHAEEARQWWNEEAHRTKHVTDKIQATMDQLNEELAEAQKTTREYNYQLGMTVATYNRISAQAIETKAYRAKLEEEVSQLYGEKEHWNRTTMEREHDARSLKAEAQELQARIAAVRQRNQKLRETATKRALSAKARRWREKAEDARIQRKENDLASANAVLRMVEDAADKVAKHERKTSVLKLTLTSAGQGLSLASFSKEQSVSLATE